MINKTETMHCGQPTVKCLIKFDDGGVRYGVVNYCKVCKQSSAMLGGGNMKFIKAEHEKLEWRHNL